ncbi:NAD(P)-binding protein [Viridothelium virens]|uniref:NAD(P)-binding protein n=1 Tax=Viridothelium virens TaxID=1048519 RepID=A0A6A6HMQ2_VIRVR|nr:NAD(P)-binding protein [Viridothelium virens]
MTYQTSKIFVVGGTGAQGMAVIRGLVNNGAYHVRALTRDSKSARAQELLKLGNVDLVEGSWASESDLRTGFRGCDGAFVNIDGFNSGEKTEMFWAIRAYELALEEGIKFFVYGNLDFVYKKSGYKPAHRTGHYDGKGRIGEWILQQTKDNGPKMGAALFTTGPYIQMTIAAGTPMTPTVEDGIVTWRVPLGEGKVPHVSLEDCEYYVRWLFDHPERANGMNLAVAVDHIGYSELAQAFEETTGHPARYIDTDLETYWSTGALSRIADGPSGYNADLNDPAAVTMRTNFTGFWHNYKYGGGKNGVIARDYKLLDEIHPNRIKSAKQWFEKEDQRGKDAGLGSLWERVQPQNLKPALKIAEDGHRGV